MSADELTEFAQRGMAAQAAVDELTNSAVVSVNGLLVDELTGEILGVAPGAGVDTARGSLFRVRDRDTAEWVLERLFEAESEILALDRRLETYTRNIEAMKAEHERRASWLRERFGDELREWAGSELAGQKKRTVRTPYGSLSFRKLAARVVVKDEAAAIEWAKANQSNAVKVTEKFLISAVPSERMQLWQNGGPRPPCFDVEPERDHFTIDTGIKA